ncbi:MAG: signal peptide peptidase SppA [candidate division Zixibacteria bacterium]|nr:signal peptide peptidase SppA [candidate division Zixibacteria bacterium]
MNKMYRYCFFFATVFWVVLTTVPAQGQERRIPIPDDVFYYAPASSVSGSEATWVNPAGLGRFAVAGFQIMADYSNDDYAKSWGAVLYRDRTTTAYRHINNPTGDDYEEMVTAMGFKLGLALDAGLSYRYFRDGPGLYKKRHFWTLGLLKRSHGPFSLGAVFSNLNRGKIDSERSAVEQRYSIGYRPFGRKLTLAADMFLSTQNRLSEADFIYNAEYIPTRGLYVNGYLDSDHNFQIGFRVNLLKYFVGSQSRFDEDGHSGRTTAFFGATNMRQPSVIRGRRRNLAVGITGGASENPPQPRFGRKRTAFLTLLTTIYRAAEDPSIASMKLSLNRLALGFGQAQELREALAYFGSRDKRIICHLGSPNNIGYFVASVADTILIPPVSQLRLVGLRAELTFWAGALDKIGVEFELLRIGDYKTAPETYTREMASEENCAQLNRLLDDLYDQFVVTMAEGRGLEPDSVRKLIDCGPFTSVEAVRYGLVDGLSYRDQVDPDYFGGIPSVSFRSYLSDTLQNDSWQTRPIIAVVVADGEIVSDGGGPGLPGKSKGVKPTEMSRAFKAAQRNPRVQGIVLRVNSPGGWALAGEEIYHAGITAAESKLLSVSMGNVAASGGYYIAMPAQRLFVNPATITGSIGIYGGKVDLSGLHEKIGLGKKLFTRGRYAGMLSTTRPFTDDEREKYQSHLQAFYDHFIHLVADNRGLTVDSIDNLSRGRVWTGREALANGLADEIGGLKQALDYTANELGLDDYEVVTYPQKRPWFIFPGRSLIGGLVSMITGNKNSPETGLLNLPISEDETILARMPFDLAIE